MEKQEARDSDKQTRHPPLEGKASTEDENIEYRWAFHAGPKDVPRGKGMGFVDNTTLYRSLSGIKNKFIKGIIHP